WASRSRCPLPQPWVTSSNGPTFPTHLEPLPPATHDGDRDVQHLQRRRPRGRADRHLVVAGAGQVPRYRTPRDPSDGRAGGAGGHHPLAVLRGRDGGLRLSAVPLHIAMRDKKLSLGMFGTRSRMFAAMAAAGFNHVVFDQMFSPLDWGETQDVCRLARQHRLAPILRVPTYPWSPGPGGDMGPTANVARARTVGAAGAVVSIGSVEQLKAILRVADDTEHMGVIGPAAVEAFRRGGEQGVRDLVPEDLRAFPIVAYIEKLD